jgi:hypothetical protein
VSHSPPGRLSANLKWEREVPRPTDRHLALQRVDVPHALKQRRTVPLRQPRLLHRRDSRGPPARLRGAALDVTALDVTALDVTALDVTALDVTALDVTVTVVAFLGV